MGSRQGTAGSDRPPVVGRREVLEALRRVCQRSMPTPNEGAFRLVGPDGDEAEVPAEILQVLERAAAALARGDEVSVVPVRRELTTQQAANVLNVSRQYLVRLLDEGQLPHRRTGSHRRVRAEDVLAFKAQRDARRMSKLDELAALSQAVGGYDELLDAE